jgi:hypothetical protein
MAQLFEGVFNKSIIHETLFFNIKTVLEYPTLEKLKEKNESLFERWKFISKNKYNADSIESEKIYNENASYYPEYSRIVAITYGNVYMENGELKRTIKRYVSENEQEIVGNFIDMLQQLSIESIQSNPQFFPILCGYNIINYDLPLLIKRFLLHKKNLTTKELPLIIKNILNVKPWESGIIDVINIWKFNGYDTTSLMLISDFLGLKKTTNLLPANELSKYYWSNIQEKPKETLDFVGLQSATQTNLIIQLMNELRQL